MYRWAETWMMRSLECVQTGKQQLQKPWGCKEPDMLTNRGETHSLTKMQWARGMHSWGQTGRQRPDQPEPCRPPLGVWGWLSTLGSHWMWNIIATAFRPVSLCQFLPSQSLLYFATPEWPWPYHSLKTTSESHSPQGEVQTGLGRPSW